jgi:hypothetical protein
LCNTLADNGFPLYIFGVNASLQQGTSGHLEENYFLEGIAHIGGGRYFQIQDVNHLDQVGKHIFSVDMALKLILYQAYKIFWSNYNTFIKQL